LRTLSLILISAKKKLRACTVPEKRQCPAFGIKIAIKKLGRLTKTEEKTNYVVTVKLRPGASAAHAASFFLGTRSAGTDSSNHL
jgi:hypothetical protein